MLHLKCIVCNQTYGSQKEDVDLPGLQGTDRRASQRADLQRTDQTAERTAPKG